MNARPWRRFLFLACGSAFIGLASQRQSSAPNEMPKFEQQRCDPPVPNVIFGEKSDANVSKRVKQLFDEDQARESSARRGKDWSVIVVEDRKRQAEISRYLEKGEINSADDLHHAAMIFQHGNCAEHYRLLLKIQQLFPNRQPIPTFVDMPVSADLARTFAAATTVVAEPTCSLLR